MTSLLYRSILQFSNRVVQESSELILLFHLMSILPLLCHFYWYQDAREFPTMWLIACASNILWCHIDVRQTALSLLESRGQHFGPGVCPMHQHKGTGYDVEEAKTDQHANTHVVRVAPTHFGAFLTATHCVYKFLLKLKKSFWTTDVFDKFLLNSCSVGWYDTPV